MRFGKDVIVGGSKPDSGASCRKESTMFPVTYQNKTVSGGINKKIIGKSIQNSMELIFVYITHTYISFAFTSIAA